MSAQSPVDPLESFRRGDAEPLQEFARQRSAGLIGFFRRLGADAAAAEDLVQETFERLCTHAARYRPSLRFEAYVMRIAYNVWVDRRRHEALRSRRAQPELPGLESLADPRAELDPAHLLERRWLASDALRALRELPEAQRLVFELGVLQELGYAEIAAALGIPEGTVKSRMHHAVRKLRAALEPRPASTEGEDA